MIFPWAVQLVLLWLSISWLSYLSGRIPGLVLLSNRDTFFVLFKCLIQLLRQYPQTSLRHRQNGQRSSYLATRVSGKRVSLPGASEIIKFAELLSLIILDLCTIHSTIHIKPLLVSISSVRLCIWRTGPSDYNYGTLLARSAGASYGSEALFIEYCIGAIPFSDTFIYSRFVGSHRRLRHHKYVTIPSSIQSLWLLIGFRSPIISVDNEMDRRRSIGTR